MYQVERKDNDVTISGPNGIRVYVTTLDAYIVFREGEALVCKQVKQLNDGALVLALASAVKLVVDDKKTV